MKNQVYIYTSARKKIQKRVVIKKNRNKQTKQETVIIHHVHHRSKKKKVSSIISKDKSKKSEKKKRTLVGHAETRSGTYSNHRGLVVAVVVGVVEGEGGGGVGDFCVRLFLQ